MDEGGPALDTAAGDVVAIMVNPDGAADECFNISHCILGPYGCILKPFHDGNACVVEAFERLPNG